MHVATFTAHAAAAITLAIPAKPAMQKIFLKRGVIMFTPNYYPLYWASDKLYLRKNYASQTNYSKLPGRWRGQLAAVCEDKFAKLP